MWKKFLIKVMNIITITMNTVTVDVITSRRIGKEVHYTIADTADGELVSDLLKTVFERRGIYEEDL